MGIDESRVAGPHQVRPSRGACSGRWIRTGRSGSSSVPAGSLSFPPQACTRRRARQEQEHRADALGAVASDLREMPRERWPDVMLPIGGQVYADEAGAATLARLAGGGQAGDPLAVTSGPWFDNMLAALEFGGRQARFSLKRAAPEATAAPRPPAGLRSRNSAELGVGPFGPLAG